MRKRVFCLLVVLSAGFSVYVLVSNAPLRVHVATALAWGLPLLALSIFFWAYRSTRPFKWILLSILLLLGGGFVSAITSLVVVKAAFTIQLWLACTVLLSLMFTFTILITQLCEWVTKKG